MKFPNLSAAAIFLFLLAPIVYAEDSGLDEPFTVEYYYRIKWGHEDEWMELYKRNHWPVLVAEIENGHILDVKLHRPRNLAPESHRWDIRVTITFKNILIPHGMVDRNREPILERLYPDRVLHEEEEDRRFELLEGLMNVEVSTVATDSWSISGQN